jgi:hypothetical protein
MAVSFVVVADAGSKEASRRPLRERGLVTIPRDGSEHRRKLPKAFVEHRERVLIENGGSVPVDRPVSVVELEVARSEVGMAPIPMEPDRHGPVGFDPVDPVVLVLGARRISKADLQAGASNRAGAAQKRRRVDVGIDVSRSAS